ncbi:MAG: hypothetical protein ACRC50_13605, partial [Gaiella sp.]
DGLSSMLSDERIAALAIGAAGPAEATEELVAAANEAGGEDNVTVVAFEIVDGEPPERPPPAATAIEAVPVASAPTPTEPAAEPDPAALPGKPVRRHGAGRGSRWPALLLLAALAFVALLALWWGLR